MRTHDFLYFIALIVSLVAIYTLSCYPDIARQVPINYLLLAAFTVCEAYLVSTMTTMFTATSVLNAAIMTAAIVIGLTAYAFTTETDFTYQGATLFMAVAGLSVATIFGLFFDSKVYDMIVSFLGACIFGLYLIYDTQLIMGGQGRASQYSIDDYIMAAVNIYIDIIQIFIEILRLIGDRR